MRIHIQTISATAFSLTPAQWEAAVARAGASSAAFQVSFADDPAGFSAGLAEAEMLVTSVDVIRQYFPRHAPKLRAVFVTSAGVDRMAPYDWLPPGAMLLNNRGAHAGKAGEFAIMALLMLANQMPAFAAAQREQRWQPLFGSVLAGRRLTVIGTGTLGAAAAQRARLFGLHVTGLRSRALPHPDFDVVAGIETLDAVLPDTDFLLLTCPLTEATRGLLDRRRLSLLPPRAGIVNMGRGALLDQDALCDRLDEGHLAGAVLDVFVPEPVPPGHRLWTTTNLVMTPHVSADDPATYNADSLDIFLDNVRAYRAGLPMPNLVDLARGY
jgi:glyoxylate/hydroxypyruvate reductase